MNQTAEPTTAPSGSTTTPSATEGLVALLLGMTAAVVDTPDTVRVIVRPHPSEPAAQLFEIQVAAGELGQALGKEGRLANAMRLIVKAAARKRELGRVLVEFTQPTTEPTQPTT